jgi:hypothetical protein
MLVIFIKTITICLLSDYYLERIITTLQLACPDALRLDTLIRDLLQESKAKFQVSVWVICLRLSS